MKDAINPQVGGFEYDSHRASARLLRAREPLWRHVSLVRKGVALAAMAVFLRAAQAQQQNAPFSSTGPQHAVTLTTGGNGSFTVTFARPFATTTPVVRADPLAGAASPQIAACMVDTITNPTTAPIVAGHCSATTAVAGGSAVANGITVMVTGADRTQ